MSWKITDTLVTFIRELYARRTKLFTAADEFEAVKRKTMGGGFGGGGDRGGNGLTPEWNRTAVVKITSNMTGGGKYLGKRAIPDYTAPVLGTGSLDLAAMYATGGESYAVVNPAEDGTSGHALAVGDYVVGVLTTQQIDGYPVVVISSASASGGFFAVKVYKDGGVAGSSSTSCTWTYTVKDFTGTTTLGTTKTPLRTRYSNCEYDLPADGSYGIAFYDSTGTLQLYDVAQEKPKGDLVTYTTSLQVSGVTLQHKTQQALVLELGTESGWTTWHTGTACS